MDSRQTKSISRLKVSLFIEFENRKENFVLAPMDVTLHDFIRMIWQLRIQSIIMLTRLFEDGKVKKLNIRLLKFVVFSIAQMFSILARRR